MGEAQGNSEVAPNRFERHPGITIAVILILLIGTIELVAYFVIRMPGFYVE